MNILICLNGKEVGTTTADSVKIDHEYNEIKAPNNVIVKRYLKSATVYTFFEDVKFNKGFYEKHSPENRYEFKALLWKLPKGVRAPKKKRVIKKFKNKYTDKFIYYNCLIKY
jgi:hypothetical protein